MAVNRRNRIEFVKLDGNTPPLSSCTSEAYNLVPDADRWTRGQNGDLPITSRPLDGISGERLGIERSGQRKPFNMWQVMHSVMKIRQYICI